MKEIQTRRKNIPRSKDFEKKNHKFAEKRLSAPFSDVSSGSTKDRVDFSPLHEISEAISECDGETVVQGMSMDLLSSPEKSSLADLTPISTSGSGERNVDVSVIVNALSVEVNELKQLILPDVLLEERSRIDEIIKAKFRVVFLFFLLWAVMALIIVFSSEEHDSYIGPLPT